jgi:hypothetical protein
VPISTITPPAVRLDKLSKLALVELSESAATNHFEHVAISSALEAQSNDAFV